MYRIAAYLGGLGLTALVWLGGCDSKPSESQAEKSLQTHVHTESEGRLKLSAFKKTNAQEGQLFGIPFYLIEFEAEVTATQPCRLDRFLGKPLPIFRTEAVPPASKLAPDDLPIGATRRLTGSLKYENTEKGWRYKSYDIEWTPSAPP